MRFIVSRSLWSCFLEYFIWDLIFPLNIEHRGRERSDWPSAQYYYALRIYITNKVTVIYFVIIFQIQ